MKITEAELKSRYKNSLDLLMHRAAQAEEHARDSLYSKPTVVARETTTGPVAVYYLSDMHIGSDSTDYGLLLKTVTEIYKNPNARIILVGDEMEGSNPAFVDTNMARVVVHAHKQVEDVIKILLPVAAKIWTIVDNYNGHGPWARKNALMETTYLIAKGLGIEDRIIQNGGSLYVEFENGSIYKERIWHNAGSGSSDINPTGHLWRNVKSGPKLDDPKYVHTATAGHHHRKAATRIVRKDMITGHDIGITLVTGGTYKYASSESPIDLHRVAEGKPPYGPPGVVQTVIPRNIGTVRSHAFITTEHDIQMVLGPAIHLWDNLVRLNEIDNCLNKALRRNPNSKPIFHPQTSRDGMGTKGTRVKQDMLYKRLDYTLPASPITIGFIANGRWGSGTTPQEPILEHMNYFSLAGRSFLFLGNMLERNVPNRPDRQEVLADLLEKTHPHDLSMLGFMLGSEFRDQRWAKQIPGSEPLRPSEEIKKNLPTTPLITHESLLTLAYRSRINSTTLMVLDGSNQSGSNRSPFIGQQNVRQESGVNCNVVIGSRSSIVGYQITPQGIDVGVGFPGGVYAEQGKVNYREAAEGGQSITLVPGLSMPIPAATFSETQDIFTATQIAFSCQQDGTLEAMIRKTDQRVRRLRK